MEQYEIKKVVISQPHTTTTEQKFSLLFGTTEVVGNLVKETKQVVFECAKPESEIEVSEYKIFITSIDCLPIVNKTDEIHFMEDFLLKEILNNLTK